MIVLDLDDSGRFFWAIFEDGIRAALLADAELKGVAYSDPSVFGKVEWNGSGGPLVALFAAASTPYNLIGESDPTRCVHPWRRQRTANFGHSR